MNTQRDVYILNFADTLYTLQLDAYYTVVPFLYGPSPSATRIIWPHFHCNSIF